MNKEFNSKEIFKNYHELQSSVASSDLTTNVQSQWSYYNSNYSEIFNFKKSIRILEIGCGSGSLLSWMQHKGFNNLKGLDLSEQDVQIAQSRNLPAECIDAEDFLKGSDHKYDVIILKAVLEHFSKTNGQELLKLIHNKLSEKGKVIIDVPNMDWILGLHERYMDITHETGFTLESMRQFTSQFFEVEKLFVSEEKPENWKQFIRIKVLKKFRVNPLFLGIILSKSPA